MRDSGFVFGMTEVVRNVGRNGIPTYIGYHSNRQHATSDFDSHTR
jgi:hypothetical protein